MGRSGTTSTDVKNSSELIERCSLLLSVKTTLAVVLRF